MILNSSTDCRIVKFKTIPNRFLALPSTFISQNDHVILYFFTTLLATTNLTIITSQHCEAGTLTAIKLRQQVGCADDRKRIVYN